MERVVCIQDGWRIHIYHSHPLKNMGIKNLEEKEIVACHRLRNLVEGEKNRRVIVRFLSRKRAEEILLKKSYINSRTKTTKIYENMYSAYRDIMSTCNTLKEIKKIDSFWFYKGTVDIRRLTDPQIFHPMDLEKLVPYLNETISSLHSRRSDNSLRRVYQSMF